MGLLDILSSPAARRLSALSMVLEAALAFRRGNKLTAGLLLGASVIALRWSWIGYVAQIGIRAYQFLR